MTTGGNTGNPLKIIMNSEIKSRSCKHSIYMQIAGFKLNNEKSVRLHGNQIPDELIKNNIGILKITINNVCLSYS